MGRLPASDAMHLHTGPSPEGRKDLLLFFGGHKEKEISYRHNTDQNGTDYGHIK